MMDGETTNGISLEYWNQRNGIRSLQYIGIWHVMIIKGTANSKNWYITASVKRARMEIY